MCHMPLKLKHFQNHEYIKLIWNNACGLLYSHVSFNFIHYHIGNWILRSFNSSTVSMKEFIRSCVLAIYTKCLSQRLYQATGEIVLRFNLIWNVSDNVTEAQLNWSICYITEVLWHDDIMAWKRFPCYWPFVRRIRRWPVGSPHKGQVTRPLMFILMLG